jgi:putative ABC transport system permease protein
MNVMLISVFERTRDIGIMKSVGARRRDVLHLFMIEAGFIGVAGGVLGILLGWLIAEITNHIMFAFVIKGQMAYQRLYEIPPWLAGGAVALAILVSVLAGVYPARRAATLDPVAALRYE